MLTYGYLPISFANLIWIGVFNSVMAENHDLQCPENNQFLWIPHEPTGWTFMLTRSVLLMLPTLLFWFAFYFLKGAGRKVAMGVSIHESTLDRMSETSSTFMEQEEQARVDLSANLIIDKRMEFSQLMEES